MRYSPNLCSLEDHKANLHCKKKNIMAYIVNITYWCIEDTKPLLLLKTIIIDFLIIWQTPCY